MTHLFRRILVPYDFSRHASRALAVAADLAAEHRGRLTVLHVVTPFYPPEGAVVWVPDVDLVGAARRDLEVAVARTVGRRAVRAECRVVIGVPFQRIIEAARGADAIVMATMGRSGLTHLLIGSVAEKVVRHSPIPVLTVRQAGARASARARTRARPVRRR